MVLFVVGALLSRGVDARICMAAGLFMLGRGEFLDVAAESRHQPVAVVWPRVVVIAGLSMIFAPLNVAAFLYIPKELRGAAVGLLALLRNEGGSVGTSVAQTIQERREQFHVLRLNERLDPLNPAVNQFFSRGQSFFLQHTGDAVASHDMTLQVLQIAQYASRSAGVLRRLLGIRGDFSGIDFPGSIDAPVGHGKRRACLGGMRCRCSQQISRPAHRPLPHAIEPGTMSPNSTIHFCCELHVVFEELAHLSPQLR